MSEPASPVPNLHPDAPIHQLLSLRFNPLVEGMTADQLRAMVQHLRMLATQHPTLNAKNLKESNDIKERTPRKLSAKAIKVQQSLSED